MSYTPLVPPPFGTSPLPPSSSQHMHMPAPSSSPAHYRSNSASSSHQAWSQSSLGQAVSAAEQEWKKRKAQEDNSADRDQPYAHKDKARAQTTDVQASSQKAVASCKECRRLKIKCDRVFPCGHCVKRGLSSICPDGELVGGKGRRPVLASTAELHQRISQLEQALQDCYSTVTGTKELHPLIANGTYNFEPLVDNSSKPLSFPQPARKSSLSKGKTAVKDSPSDEEVELGEVSNNMGLLTLGDEGTSRWHGGGGSAYLLAEDASSPGSTDSPRPPTDHQRSTSSTELDPSPEGADSPSSTSLAMRSALEALMTNLPSQDEAVTLAKTYYRNGAWMYGCLTRDYFFGTVLPHVYASPEQSEREISSQKLAVVFYALALGCLFDLDLPPQSKRSKRYFELANSALNLNKNASLDYIRALLLSSNWVMHLTSTVATSGESSWAILGTAVRASLALGLHRDGENWNLPEEASEERRLLFWEVAAYDKLQACNLGRPTGLKEATIDTKFPAPSGSRLDLYPQYKYRFVHLLERVNNAQSFVRVQSFESVLKLDRDIRLFQKTLPPQLHAVCDKTAELPDSEDAEGRSFFVQQQSAKELINISLLFLHRSWFARALKDHPEEPLNSKWSQSYVAVLEASKTIIGILEAITRLRLALVSRYWLFYFHAFTASVSLAAAVIQAPGSSLAQAALREVEKAVSLFERLVPGSRPKDELPTLRRLRDRAAEKVRSASTPFNASNAPPIAHTSTSGSSGTPLPEELDLLGTETALHRPVHRQSSSAASTSAYPLSTDPSPPYPLVASPLPTTLEEAFAAQPISQSPQVGTGRPGDASFDLFTSWNNNDPSNYFWGGGAGVGVMGGPPNELEVPMMDGLAPGVGTMGMGDGSMNVDFFGVSDGAGATDGAQPQDDFDFDAFLSSLGVVPGTAPGRTPGT